MPAALADPAMVATFGGAIAHIEYRLDRHADAEVTASRALAAARAARNHGAQAVCLNVLGSCALRLGRPADAGRFFALARRRALASANPKHTAALLDNQALAEKALGRYDEALRLSLQSLLQHRSLRDAAGEALCLNNLGALYMAKDDWDSARINLHQGIVICDRHGIVGTRALILGNLTEIAIETGDLEAAETFGRRALDAAHTAGNRSLGAYLGLLFVRLAVNRSDLPRARVDLAAALTIAIATGRQPLQLAAVSCFAEVLAAQGETRCARLVWNFAAGHPSLSAPQRSEIRARLAKWPLEAGAEPAWPGLELDELVHRIVAEAAESHAPLIAGLRGGH
jgi:tetratricopeptide (TPR) repeat protein